MTALGPLTEIASVDIDQETGQSKVRSVSQSLPVVAGSKGDTEFRSEDSTMGSPKHV
jgi:hypothetical protein